MRLLTSTLFLFLSVSSFSQSGINAKADDKGILVSAAGKPVFYYHISEALPPSDSSMLYKRSGFIHPLYSPSGKILTDDFPAGHAHQHGIFFTWTSTLFRGTSVDFWNQQSGKGTAKHEALLGIKQNKKEVEVKTKLAHVSTQFGTILEEIWTIRVYQLNGNIVIDLQSDQTNITKYTLYLKKYHYGGLAYRGSREWNVDDKKYFTNKWRIQTSDGKDTSNANASHAEWIDASGIVENVPAGVTIFSHPSNFRHPQPLRVHPQMDYWAFSPMVDEGFTINPGAHYRSRYLIFAHDGLGDTEKIKKLYQSWIANSAKGSSAAF